MPLLLRPVHRLLQRAQHRVIHGVLRRFAVDFLQHALQFEPAFEALAFDAEFLHELRQLLQPPRVGLAVHAAQERPVLVEEQPRDRFIRRQHELFDHLMALGVHRRHSAVDRTIGGERDANFAHRKFQRAPRETASCGASSPARACRARSFMKPAA